MEAVSCFDTADVAEVTKRLRDEVVFAVDDPTWVTKASANGLAGMYTAKARLRSDRTRRG